MNEISLSRAKGPGDWLNVWWLYQRAFPRAERKPFGIMARMAREGKTDVWIFRNEGRFAGLGITINGENLILLDYFAVETRFRGKGIGTTALKRIMEQYEDRGFFLEIEGTWEPVDDLEMRKRRKKFYLNCGLEELFVRGELFGVNMELLGLRCQLDFDRYKAFYRDYYSPWAADHVRPVKEG